MISTPVATLRKTITKGNRRRIMRRTPKSYRGYCSGFGQSDRLPDQVRPETSWRPVCFVARTNRQLPRLLRTPQGGFAVNRRSLRQPVAKAPSCSAPGDQSHGSFVNLLQPKLDLLLPRFCRAFVDGRIQAFDQRIDQRGPRLQRQSKGVAKQICRMALHVLILTPDTCDPDVKSASRACARPGCSRTTRDPKIETTPQVEQFVARDESRIGKRRVAVHIWTLTIRPDMASCPVKSKLSRFHKTSDEASCAISFHSRSSVWRLVPAFPTAIRRT
jgi:hypothetical protein